MGENILIHHPADGVGLIQINRPDKRNALNYATLKEIAAALTTYASEESIHVVIITGDERAFAAGADVTEMVDKSTVDAAKSDRPQFWKTLRHFPKPLIAAVSGWCLGGGNELAMSCDMIVASETARFGQPEINLAIIPGAGGTQRLTRAVGKAVTMEMVLAGRFLSAQEALGLGLINSIHPPELYLDKAISLASQIAAKAPIALQLAKDSVQKAFELTLEEGLIYEQRNHQFLYSTEDKVEGISAFLEKRPPNWKGK